MKKQSTILLTLIFILGLTTINVDNTIAQEDQIPEILSILPSKVYEGDYLTILGKNFLDCDPYLSTISNNPVGIFLDGVKITSYYTFSPTGGKNKWANEKIVLAVNKTGKLKVTNCSGLTSNEVDLVVTKRNPFLTSVEPNKGYVGSSMTINGNDFGDRDPGSSYQFYLNGEHINRGYIGSWSNNSFKLLIPSTLGGNLYGNEKEEVIPGDYELQIKLGKNSNNIYEYSNKITITVLESCTQDKWVCGEYNSCSISGNQTRSCTKTFDCPLTNTPSPTITQSCTYTPTCSADIWACGDWNSCSLSGIQNRSCKKTFDCSRVEDIPPTTSQYCEIPNKPQNQLPQNSDVVVNQDTIIKATVKLLCQLDEKWWSQGSGTIIDSSGLILTNEHVVRNTLGCLVGFIDDFDDEPYFGNRQIADIQKISSNEDMALLKLRNPQNKKLVYINITNNNINFHLGDNVNVYGYPDKFGKSITYTSGDFSGIIDNYLKTTAILEHGNSGGGAYLSDGKFIGIPTFVRKGELNALGYILSVNVINSWMGNSGIVYNNNSQNNYSRVSSVLENIDLETLDLLEIVVPAIIEEKDIEVVPDSSITSPLPIETITIIPANKSEKELEISKQNSVAEENLTATGLNNLDERSNEDISENTDKKVISNTKEVKQKSLWERIKNWLIFWK